MRSNSEKNQFMKPIIFSPLTFATLALTTISSFPGQGFTQESSICDHCKAKAYCTKVCHLVYEEKKVEVVCWGCEREEFCVPDPSTPKCEHCKEVKCNCSEGLRPNVASQPKAFTWTSWLPGAASVFTKKKLMKRTTIEKIPTHKWVVEDLCPECKQKISASQP